MKAKDLLSLLQREPLGYYVHRQSGSHRVMRSNGRPQLIFAFHEGATIPSGLVRKILVKDVGLTVDEISALLS